MNKELLGGVVGTGLSAVGTATQTNEMLQTISLVITIVGGIISLIVIPIISWYQKAKKDGKITKDEIQEGIEIVQNGIDQLKNDDKKKGE